MDTMLQARLSRRTAQKLALAALSVYATDRL